MSDEDFDRLLRDALRAGPSEPSDPDWQAKVIAAGTRIQASRARWRRVAIGLVLVAAGLGAVIAAAVLGLS